MSKVIRLEPSHLHDTNRRTSATPPSHPRDTGSSNYKSYSLISYYRSHPRDPLGEMTGEVEVATRVSRARPRPTVPFLKGPIPLAPLAVAARLPGKALALYVALQHRCDLEGKSTVTLPAALLRDFGVGRDTKARALRTLEDAGLIRVKRTTGRTARITLDERSRCLGDRH